MKAFIISNEDRECSCVIFHSHGMAARRLGSEQLESNFEDTTCSRAKDLDCYSDIPNEPSIKTLVTKHGWWWSCSKCDGRVETSEDGILEGGFLNGVPYCSECKEEWPK